MDNHFSNRSEFARQSDKEDLLREFREEFFIPGAGNKPQIYFCGNSLGLQPKTTGQAIQEVLSGWAQKGVEAYFDERSRWIEYHHQLKIPLSVLLGCSPEEVCPMNSLTVNLHLLLASFYRPVGPRNKILIEAGAFPSDRYAITSHLQLRGLDPNELVVEVNSGNGSPLIPDENIINAIWENKDHLALILLSGIHYYSGQLFNLKTITQKANSLNIPIGFDLAHVIGNVPLQLRDWGVDFATWCSYKYLNSGPGNISGIFLHQKNFINYHPAVTGWWGIEPGKRFLMENDFIPAAGADGWQVSNPSITGLAAHRNALDLFMRAGIHRVREKSIRLTGFLENILRDLMVEFPEINILTPSDPERRGCQLSITLRKNGKKIFEQLFNKGVIGDWREPDVIRLAPAPLYNTFEEVYQAGQILKDIMVSNSK